MSNKFMLLIVFTMLLVSCASPEEKAMRARRIQQETIAKEKAYMLELQTRCDGFGFKRETDKFANCVMNQRKRDEDKAYREAQLKEQAAERSRKQWRDINESLQPHWIPEK